MNWSKLHTREVRKEDLVMGINTIELLERASPYINNKENYFNRVKKSLSFIPEEFKDAALAIYSSVIYIPNQFLNATHHFLGSSFKEQYDIHTSEEIGQSSHIFEVDPSGLKNLFYQINGINQRLHPDYYARIDEITDVARTLMALFHTDEKTIQAAFNDILKLAKKKYWIILTDKALSGQSLVKDIERYLVFREITQNLTENLPIICIKAQIITSDAINTLSTKLTNSKSIELEYCIQFSEAMKVNNENSILFNSDKIRIKANKLCEWLAEVVILPDNRFDTMRSKSGDNLQYGYKKCGLTLADYSNCPTNSVPLLWYDNTDTKLPNKYKGPFPRVQSRLGIQIEQPVGDAWDTVEKRREEIIEKLKNLQNA